MQAGNSDFGYSYPPCWFSVFHFGLSPCCPLDLNWAPFLAVWSLTGELQPCWCLNVTGCCWVTAVQLCPETAGEIFPATRRSRKKTWNWVRLYKDSAPVAWGCLSDCQSVPKLLWIKKEDLPQPNFLLILILSLMVSMTASSRAVLGS